MSDEPETRELLVFGDKTFKIRIPVDARVTFAPFSPPNKDHGYAGAHGDRAVGTLRVYGANGRKEDNCMACFAGVRGFRDTSLDYAEEVAREEGAVIWKSDERGYEREEKLTRRTEWVDGDELAEIEPPKRGRK